MLLKVSAGEGACARVSACCAQVCRWILTQMVRGWEVMQEVLPKQAPDAAETNGKRDDIEKREKEKKGKEKNPQKTEAELCLSNSAAQVELNDEALLFINALKNSTNTHVG